MWEPPRWREARVVESVFENANRPGPARPDPARPGISATRLPPWKTADFGPPLLVGFGLFLGSAGAAWPPGGYPKGGYPPGGYPPGEYPPGGYPSGVLAPGGCPPGRHLLGGYPRGEYSPGEYSPGYPNPTLLEGAPPALRQAPSSPRSWRWSAAGAMAAAAGGRGAGPQRVPSRRGCSWRVPSGKGTLL